MQVAVCFTEAAQHGLMQLEINDDAIIGLASCSMQQCEVNKSYCIEGTLLHDSQQYSELIARVIAWRSYHRAVCKIQRFGQGIQMAVRKICAVPEKRGFFGQRIEAKLGPELVESLPWMQACLQPG